MPYAGYVATTDDLFTEQIHVLPVICSEPVYKIQDVIWIAILQINVFFLLLFFSLVWIAIVISHYGLLSLWDALWHSNLNQGIILTLIISNTTGHMHMLRDTWLQQNYWEKKKKLNTPASIIWLSSHPLSSFALLLLHAHTFSLITAKWIFRCTLDQAARCQLKEGKGACMRWSVNIYNTIKGYSWLLGQKATARNNGV